MAFITLQGTLLDPNGSVSAGDELRFTHKSTTGSTLKSAVTLLKLTNSGNYYIDLQYGLVLVEYKDVRNSQFENLGVATVNSTNPATTIPELLNALTPVSSTELIEFQGILADTVTAKNEAVAAKVAAEAAAATVDVVKIPVIYETVALFKASMVEYPDGKTIHLNDRGADFTKITGNTATNDEDIIYSTNVNQSISLVTDGELSLSAMGAGGGINNDSGTIQRAVALVKINGYALGANSNDHFFVGTFADSGDDSRFIIDFDNFTFNSNGCLFTGIASIAPAQAAASNQAIFKHKSGSNVTFGDFRVEADAVDRTSNIGIIALAVKSEASHQNLNIGNITGSKLSSVFTCSSTDPANFRLRRVRAKKLFNTNGYYTVNCANNCDDFQAQISNQDIVRSYFVYGVENHRVSVHSTSHNKFTDILIKRYGYDTKDIHVNYMAQNDTSSNASISIEHQNDTQDGLIEDVYITLNVEKSNVANPTLNFAQITDVGAVATTTTSRTHNIHVKGTTNSSTPTVFGSALVGGNLSELYLTADLLKRNYDFKHYIIKEGETATSLAVSDDSGNLNMRFNVTKFAGIPNWGLLTVFGADNAGSSAAEFITIKVWVQFTVSSLGVVTIGSTQVIDTFTTGTLAPTATYPAGATGSFELGVNVNNYTNAGRKSRAKLEVFGLRF